ncbi:MAG: mechanosensitive ion channel family protein [Deltaproteobacteria bacterium]|nr:mechanosensitive ion channel family protein [Deltaproteobacteria bacterium]
MHMAPLIAENVQTTVSVILAALLLGLRALAQHEQLKKDCGGAAKYFLTSLAANIAASTFDAPNHPRPWVVYLDALGLLLFTWGCCRTVVGLTIWVFRSRRNVPTPKIVRDVVDGVLYALCLVVVLRATLKVDLASLVATSAALSVVVGLALQETLGNLFAGLSLQLEHPFQVGDWVGMNEFVGRVVQVAWRGTKLETLRREQVTVPNSSIAKANVVNFSRHGIVAKELTVGVAYKAPPNLVKAALLDVLTHLPEIVQDPPPRAQVLRFDDSAVTYQLRFFVKGFENVEVAADAVLSALWYRLKREGMEIPFPQRTLQLERVPPQRNVLAHGDDFADTVELLSTVDFLKPLGDDGRASLARGVQRELYGRGEPIIRAGDQGDAFHMVAAGEVIVRAKVGEKEQEVARLRRGEFFGEMSLLTGEPRSATVLAATDATLVTMHRGAFAEVLAQHNTVAGELAEILARRRAHLAEAKAGADDTQNQRAESKRIFGRLRELFKVT